LHIDFISFFWFIGYETTDGPIKLMIQFPGFMWERHLAANHSVFGQTIAARQIALKWPLAATVEMLRSQRVND
jgi:hypothetical protein